MALRKTNKSFVGIRHGRLKRSSATKNVLRGLLTTALVLTISGMTVAAYALWDLRDSVSTISLSKPTSQGENFEYDGRPIDGEFAIALIGSDTREGQVGYQDGVEGELNDVNLLLYVDESHQNATVISFSRDLMIPIPSCPGPNGEEFWTYAESEGQINTALDKGGLVCAVRTLEELVGFEIPYAGLITFDGVINMSNAIGGVDICLTEPIYDPHTGLDLEAGDVTLVGYDALQFLRTRHGVGDGGDSSRISNQQVFMASMVRQLQETATFADPVQVYKLAKAAVESMTMSDTLVQIPVMQSMAMVLKDLDLERINFVQYPSAAHAYDENRYSPDWYAAEELLTLMQAGQPFEVTSLGVAVQEGKDATPDIYNPEFEDPVLAESENEDLGYDSESWEENESLEPGQPLDPSKPAKINPNITGQSAAQVTCSQGRTVW
ncbi:MAG TPA: LCP family protein [Microbacteriaceae bacterium]|nr:LCP family protein [Microbacteriaceae bacterium]